MTVNHIWPRASHGTEKCGKQISAPFKMFSKLHMSSSGMDKVLYL